MRRQASDARVCMTEDAMSSASTRNTSAGRHDEIVQTGCAEIRRSTSTQESANLADPCRNRGSSIASFVGATKRCDRKAKVLPAAQVILHEVTTIPYLSQSHQNTRAESDRIFPASLLRTPPHLPPRLHESAKRVLDSLAPLSFASHTRRSTVGSLN